MKHILGFLIAGTLIVSAEAALACVEVKEDVRICFDRFPGAISASEPFDPSLDIVMIRGAENHDAGVWFVSADGDPEFADPTLDWGYSVDDLADAQERMDEISGLYMAMGGSEDALKQFGPVEVNGWFIILAEATGLADEQQQLGNADMIELRVMKGPDTVSVMNIRPEGTEPQPPKSELFDAILIGGTPLSEVLGL